MLNAGLTRGAVRGAGLSMFWVDRKSPQDGMPAFVGLRVASPSLVAADFGWLSAAVGSASDALVLARLRLGSLERKSNGAGGAFLRAASNLD